MLNPVQHDGTAFEGPRKLSPPRPVRSMVAPVVAVPPPAAARLPHLAAAIILRAAIFPAIVGMAHRPPALLAGIADVVAIAAVVMTVILRLGGDRGQAGRAHGGGEDKLTHHSLL